MDSSTDNSKSLAKTDSEDFSSKAEMMRKDMVHSSRGLERHPNVERALEAYDKQMDSLRAAADSEAAHAVMDALAAVKNSFLGMLQSIKESPTTQAVAEFGSEVATTTSQAVADLGNEISAAAHATYDEYMGPPVDDHQQHAEQDIATYTKLDNNDVKSALDTLPHHNKSVMVETTELKDNTE